MSRLKLVWQRGKLAFLAAAGSLAVHGTALAQGQTASPTGGGGSYVASYALVIAGIALGLLLVCRSSHRRDRAQPEHYEGVLANPDEKE